MERLTIGCIRCFRRLRKPVSDRFCRNPGDPRGYASSVNISCVYINVGQDGRSCAFAYDIQPQIRHLRPPPWLGSRNAAFFIVTRLPSAQLLVKYSLSSYS